MKPKEKSHPGGVSSDDLERAEAEHDNSEAGFGDHGSDLGMGAPPDPRGSEKKEEKKP